MLPLAQHVQQFPVWADDVGGVAGGQPTVAAGVQSDRRGVRVIANTRVCVDISNIRMPSSSLSGSTLTAPTMNERCPTENVVTTTSPIAAPMNHGVASSTAERTWANSNRSETAAPKSLS